MQVGLSSSSPCISYFPLNIDNWATHLEQPNGTAIMEMFPRLSPWTMLSVPPAIVTSRTVPTIPLITVIQVKELELSALRSLNIL